MVMVSFAKLRTAEPIISQASRRFEPVVPGPLARAASDTYNAGRFQRAENACGRNPAVEEASGEAHVT
jgi:hypothetical protein